MLKVQEIRELIKLVDESSINEFTYETDDTSVSMKKSDTTHVYTEAEPSVTRPKQEVVPDKAEPAEPKTEENIKTAVPEETPSPESTADFDHEIVSPMVGTFYTKPNPDSDMFVSRGSTVEKDTVVCIVEAMKLFNEIEAETSGEITDVLVENGELVEYGQPLFRVKTK